MYIELANAINGARLRTKYLANSNLPDYTDYNTDKFNKSSHS